MTLAIVTGWLLTTANLGDSAAHLDNGLQASPLTTCHRVDSNTGEPGHCPAHASHFEEVALGLEHEQR